jgi:AraC-like DNA-binding protein
MAVTRSDEIQNLNSAIASTLTVALGINPVSACSMRHRVIRRFSSWSGVLDRSGAPSTLDRARQYLHDRISDDVSLDDLGTETGLTKFHLLRAFRNRFGLPPHAYQLQQRVLQAKRMLKSFSPAYVALECGFSDQSHFTRVFRAHTGTTPRRYAEQFVQYARTTSTVGFIQ